jgi:hypothetical protein
MKSARRLIILSLVAFGLAACATQPQPDFTPPPAKGRDAKTTLENRR